MSRFLPALLALFIVAFVHAQNPPAPIQPRLYVVTPCGAKAGSSVDLTLSGDGLDIADGLLFSDTRVQSKKIETPALDPKDPKKPPSGGMAGPSALNSYTRFTVTVPADVPLGGLDVRVVTKGGVSNPRCFWVGDTPEVLETEPNNDLDQAQELKLNSVAHGTILAPTDVDFFSFRGKAGSRVVVSCQTTSVDSRLQAAVQLFDPAGRQLQFNRAYRGDDALVDATLADDGLHIVRVSQFTHTAGGPEYFYRLAVSTAPWIDAVFPPAIEPGKPTKVTVYGRNLPGGTPDASAVVDGRTLDKLSVTIDPPKNGGRLDFPMPLPPNHSGIDGFAWTIRNEVGTSNPTLVGIASAPVVLDNGKNDTVETAQTLAVPCEVAGRIEKKRDRDWFAFSATKGSVWSIEALADRIGSSVDVYLTVYDAKRKPMIEADENLDAPVSMTFFCRTDDPARYRFTAPEDGVYHVMVATRESFIQAGPRDQYRLRITPEQPDFRLVVQAGSPTQPDAPVLGQGGHQALNVVCWRQDGFAGPIELTAEGLPAGVTCQPQSLAPGQKQGALVFAAAADAPAWTGTLKVRGKATIDGKEVVREARTASVQWPLGQNSQGVPALARLDRDLTLAVREAPPFKIIVKTEKLTVNPGDKVNIPIGLEKLRADFKGPLALSLFNPPGNLKLIGEVQQQNVPSGVPVPVDKTEQSVQLDLKPGFAPGVYTLVLRGAVLMPPPATSKSKTPIPYQLPSTPVTLVVLPKSLATVTNDAPEAKVRPGQSSELKLKVARSVDGVGALTVDAVVPVGNDWLKVQANSLKAGEDEVTVLFTATDAAPVGQAVKVVVKLTGTFEGSAITTEVKVNLTVGSKK